MKTDFVGSKDSRPARGKARFSVFLAGCLVFLVAAPSVALGQEWRFYGGDAGGRRFSPLQQISGANVNKLQRAWTYHMGEADRGSNETDRHHVAPFESTPLEIAGVL